MWFEQKSVKLEGEDRLAQAVLWPLHTHRGTAKRNKSMFKKDRNSGVSEVSHWVTELAAELYLTFTLFYLTFIFSFILFDPKIHLAKGENQSLRAVF